MIRSWQCAAGLAALTLAVVMVTAAPALAEGRGVYYVRGYDWGHGGYGSPYFDSGSDGSGYRLDSGRPSNGGYGTNGYPYSYRYYPAYSDYYSPNRTLSPSVPSTSYYYNPSLNITPSSYAADQDMRATINVTVPTNAKVWFDDAPTQQTGVRRLFTSPPLVPNGTFYYTVRVQWDDNSKMKEETRRVEVRAAQTSVVDFTRPASQ
jgi:uncharacterized protein (TIGR03000 family)